MVLVGGLAQKVLTAGVVKLVYTPALGAGPFGGGGSSPLSSTTNRYKRGPTGPAPNLHEKEPVYTGSFVAPALDFRAYCVI